MNFPTRQEFEAWLRSLPPEQEVAPRKYGCCECPIANYLLSHGNGYAYVSPAPTKLNSGLYKITRKEDEWKFLPEWANSFACAADKWACNAGNPKLLDMAPITAARALALLEGIEE